jgi:hypothetical protein
LIRKRSVFGEAANDDIEYGYSESLIAVCFALRFSRDCHIYLWKSWQEVDNIAAQAGNTRVLCN